VLANLARTVGRLAVLAQPFLPTTAQRVWDTLGPSPSQPLSGVRLADLATLDLAGRHILKPPILFPKPRLPQP
jgi:methionyl-tRNA synthetase